MLAWRVVVNSFRSVVRWECILYTCRTPSPLLWSWSWGQDKNIHLTGFGKPREFRKNTFIPFFLQRNICDYFLRWSLSRSATVKKCTILKVETKKKLFYGGWVGTENHYKAPHLFLKLLRKRKLQSMWAQKALHLSIVSIILLYKLYSTYITRLYSEDYYYLALINFFSSTHK